MPDYPLPPDLEEIIEQNQRFLAEEKRHDARRAKGWKHTADFLNQLANTTVSLGFLAPLATWAFAVANNPLSSGAEAPYVAGLWLFTGMVLHIVAATIVRSFDL